MTDQYQWQGALAAAERAIRDEQLDDAESSLQIALTHIGSLERGDPARISILELFIRCCAQAAELSTKQSLLGLQRKVAGVHRTIALTVESPSFTITMRQALTQLPDDSAEQHRRNRINHRLHNYHVDAASMLLTSQISQLGEASEAVISTLLTLARLAWGKYGREFDTFPLLEQALAIRERTLGFEHQDTLAIVGQLAMRYDTLVGYEKSLSLWQRLLVYAEQQGPLTIHNAHYGVPEILFALGKAYNYLRLYSEAINTWKRYLKLLEQEVQQMTERFAVEKLHQIDAYYGVGNACLKQEDWSQARSFLARAVSNHRIVPKYSVTEGNGLSGIDLAQGIAAYAEAIARSGEHDKALSLLVEAIVLYKRRDRQYTKVLDNYATALRATGKIAEAVVAEREALVLMKSFEAMMRRHDAFVATHPDHTSL